ncbi:MAG TPA: class I SAM-dependent methyltransferase [Candidatus Limnocylindria bacterium]|jgi:SAM-dependent methyltransferase|nr:class I SAM-dependent methyltransferase [Candidatus Limnocylindria bacterium]
MKPLRLLEYLHSWDDDQFDLIYPREIRELSDIHWTPLKIARAAAEFLAPEPGIKVLDVGCGPGKFCIAGALSTQGDFTGIEQRKYLCDLAHSVMTQAGIPNARVFHGNVNRVDFSQFEAFYLFNPFEENLEPSVKIDPLVDLAESLYEAYTEHVATQLTQAPLGTRVATYCGLCQEIPMGYDCQMRPEFRGLKFWTKTKNYAVRGHPAAA